MQAMPVWPKGMVLRLPKMRIRPVDPAWIAYGPSSVGLRRSKPKRLDRVEEAPADVLTHGGPDHRPCGTDEEHRHAQ